MRKKRIIYLIVLFLLLAVIIVLQALIKQNNKIQDNEERILEIKNEDVQPEIETKVEPINSSVIGYPAEYNFAQSYNNCAPYNSAAVVRALTGVSVSSEEFAKTISGRTDYNWTLPEGIVEQLNKNGINTDTPDLSQLSDEEKINYLKEELSLKHPIILLIKKDEFPHYITLLGFNGEGENDEFYIYDSLMERQQDGLTKDENGELPGNKNLDSVKLLEAWSGGEIFKKYRWTAIFCQN